ncbi:hypothetical protein H4R33_004952 [Dimargaris cristalligena]|nr:hypothetical protein H4R33_004952 [Dimargaris cristalligena]
MDSSSHAATPNQGKWADEDRSYQPIGVDPSTNHTNYNSADWAPRPAPNPYYGESYLSSGVPNSRQLVAVALSYSLKEQYGQLINEIQLHAIQLHLTAPAKYAFMGTAHWVDEDATSIQATLDSFNSASPNDHHQILSTIEQGSQRSLDMHRDQQLILLYAFPTFGHTAQTIAYSVGYSPLATDEANTFFSYMCHS